MVSYTQSEFLEILRTYNNFDRKSLTLNLLMVTRKRSLKNKRIIEETGYSEHKVNSWFALSSPNIPTFEDALMLAVKYDFDIKELIKE